MKLKKYFSAQELADFGLKTLPQTRQGVSKKAKTGEWLGRKRVGSQGGGYEYAFDSLPAEVQAEIREKVLEQASDDDLIASYVEKADKKRELKATKPNKLPQKRLDGSNFEFLMEVRDVSELSQKQRDLADSRLAVIAYIDMMGEETSRNRATHDFVDQARAHSLPEHLQNHVARAVSRKSKDVISVRTIQTWQSLSDKASTPEERLKALANFKSGRKEATPENTPWFGDFMAIYRNKNGVSVAEAYLSFERLWEEKYAPTPCPSKATVQRLINKVPKHLREIGRRSGASMKALKTYRKRMWPENANEVWCGDGHSLKLKVAHPKHFQPFTPELTLIMDTASRYIVGWSLAYSESVIAVGDALRHAIQHNGIPCIYYSDNGSGQKNKEFDHDITGVLPRLGIHHETGLPGNPQGRGIIERANDTIGNRIARQFDTFYGNGADPDYVNKMLKGMKSLSDAMCKNKKELTEKQQWAKNRLPSWAQLLEVIEQVIRWYNCEHKHSALGMTPYQAREAQLRKMPREEFIRPTAVELRDLFRPQEIHKTNRGWVTVDKKDYWHEDLINFSEQDVIVGVDIHDDSFVIIRNMAGDFVCEAKINGNSSDAFSKTRVEEAKVKRANSAIKNAQLKIDKAQGELRSVIDVVNEEDSVLFEGLAQAIEGEVVDGEVVDKDKPIFHTNADREEWEAEQTAKKKKVVGGDE